MQPPAWESLPEHASVAEGPAGAAGNGGQDQARLVAGAHQLPAPRQPLPLAAVRQQPVMPHAVASARRDEI
jgi:hypothetical protein